jgi:hypothetical protein
MAVLKSKTEMSLVQESANSMMAVPRQNAKREPEATFEFFFLRKRNAKPCCLKRSARRFCQKYLDLGRDFLMERFWAGLFSTRRGRSDDAGRRVLRARLLDRYARSGFCRPAFPCSTPDACGLRGSNGHIHREGVSNAAR